VVPGVVAAVVNVKSKEKAKDHLLGMQMVVYNMERAAAMAEAVGQEKWLWIIDLHDYTRANSPPTRITKETLFIMSNHYPERLYKYVPMWHGRECVCFGVCVCAVWFCLSVPLQGVCVLHAPFRSRMPASGAGFDDWMDWMDVLDAPSCLVRAGAF